MTSNEWQHLQKYVETLEPVKEANVLMSCEAHPTLLQYYPIVEMLKRATATEPEQVEGMKAVEN